MIERVKSRFDLRPRRLAGDTVYGAVRLLKWLVDRGITPHIPVWDKSARSDGTFSRSDFVFDPELNIYVCPGGAKLTSTGNIDRGHFVYYRASKNACSTCALKPKSKIHAVVDTNGLPVRLGLTAGEVHDNRLALSFLSRLRSGSMLLADRGYDADWIRAFANERGAWANVPPRSNRREPICFSPYLYRARNLVERFFNKIKQCRRVATRYDKLAANYLAFIQLASIRLWLRVL